MVNKRMSRGGLFDWLVQRVTAVIVGIYAIFIIAYLLSHTPLSYEQWHNLYTSTWLRISTVIVLISVLWHAWIGLWTVFTDYVKAKPVRLFLEFLVILGLLACLVWVLDILWR